MGHNTMTVSDFIAKLSTPSSVDFEDTMTIINEHYNYQPTAFSNGTGDSKVTNDAGQNEGSCKIFAFAQLNELSQEATLLCFGRFYQDVLNTPQGTDHSNIRNFIKDGWAGIKFEGTALSAK